MARSALIRILAALLACVAIVAWSTGTTAYGDLENADTLEPDAEDNPFRFEGSTRAARPPQFALGACDASENKLTSR